MEKIFALVESIPAGRMTIIDNLTFDQVKQVVHKYSSTHTCKLFGVEVCTLHGILLLAKELPVCPIVPSFGYFNEEKVEDYHDRSRTWYTFMGKSTARYALSVYAIAPTDKPPRNIIEVGYDPAHDEFEKVISYVTLGTGCLDDLDEEAILQYHENESFAKEFAEEIGEDDEYIPTIEENARHFAVLEKAEEILLRRSEEGSKT